MSRPLDLRADISIDLAESLRRLEARIRRACMTIENWHIVTTQRAGKPVSCAVYTSSALIQRLVADELAAHGVDITFQPHPDDNPPFH